MATEQSIAAREQVLSEIDAIVKSDDRAPVARPSPKQVAGGPAGALIVEPNRVGGKRSRARDEDADDALPDLTPTAGTQVVKPGPVRVVGIAGVPNPEDYQPLIEARAASVAVEAKMLEADGDVATLSAKLGVPANASRGRMEALEIELLADGRDTADIAALSAAANRARLLRAAAVKAAARIQPLLDIAVRQAAAAARELVMAPAEREMAEALLAFIVKARETQRVADELRFSGLAGGVDRKLPEIVDTNPIGNYAIQCAVRAGYLTREQVQAALPGAGY